MSPSLLVLFHDLLLLSSQSHGRTGIGVGPGEAFDETLLRSKHTFWARNYGHGCLSSLNTSQFFFLHLGKQLWVSSVLLCCFWLTAHCDRLLNTHSQHTHTIKPLLGFSPVAMYLVVFSPLPWRKVTVKIFVTLWQTNDALLLLVLFFCLCVQDIQSKDAWCSSLLENGEKSLNKAED